jgi:hypothetical protein
LPRSGGSRENNVFIWPVSLVLLLLIPLFVVLYVRLQRRRRRLAASYANFGLGQQAGSRRIGARRHVPIILFLIGLTILIAALARPQTVVSLPRIETASSWHSMSPAVWPPTISNPLGWKPRKPPRGDYHPNSGHQRADRRGLFQQSGFSVQVPTNDQVLFSPQSTASLRSAVARLRHS